MKTRFVISGMTCGHCAEKVKGALLGHSDIKSAKVDHHNATAEIESEKAPSVKELNDLLSQAGDYSIKQEKDADDRGEEESHPDHHIKNHHKGNEKEKQHEHDHSRHHDSSSEKKHTGHSHHGGHDHGDHAGMIQDFRKRFWITLILTFPIVLLAPMIQHLLGYELRFTGDTYVQFILSSVVFFYGGWPFIKGMGQELSSRAPGMMTLISLAITVAYVYSSAVVFGLEGDMFFWELSTLVAIMLLGHWIEMKSVMGASDALSELAKLMPSEAIRINENGDQEKVPVSDLKQGDVVLVRPGEKLPADGNIKEGESYINEAMITGESVPVSKKAGDQVIGGSVIDNGVLRIEVKNTGEDSYLSKVIGMVEEAQKSKSRTQNLANKAAGLLFYVALGAGFITLGTWLALGRDFGFALERMVTVMIISCPHALGLAVPLVVSISTSVSASKGLLIRNRTAFENARKITTIIFDKTGTLTKGKFGVTRFKSVSQDFSDEEILSIAASLEANSEHPIGAGIVKKAEDLNLETKQVKEFSNLKGKGIKAVLDGKDVRVVSPGALKEMELQIPEDSHKDESETVVYLVIDKKPAGYIALADEIREESFDAIKTLREKGLKVVMATGDNEKVAKSVSKTLGLDDYYSQVLPEDKQKIIKELQEKGEFVAMTGDGVNDAPALAQANIGIAVGSGTDVAAQTADIVLVNSNPKDITSMILFGKATYNKMIQNLVWATGYNVVAIPLAAGVLIGAGILLSPAVGAVLMSLSTIIVAVNAQLLRKQIRS